MKLKAHPILALCLLCLSSSISPHFWSDFQGCTATPGRLKCSCLAEKPSPSTGHYTPKLPCWSQESLCSSSGHRSHLLFYKTGMGWKQGEGRSLRESTKFLLSQTCEHLFLSWGVPNSFPFLKRASVGRKLLFERTGNLRVQ